VSKESDKRDTNQTINVLQRKKGGQEHASDSYRKNLVIPVHNSWY
jgi:hypothetical protein